MFSFTLNDIHEFVDAIFVIANLHEDAVDLKFSPETFSIIASSSSFCPCIIGLQLFPQFFDLYFCHKLQYSWIYMESFYPIVVDFVRSGFSSLTFSIPKPERAALTFECPNGRYEEFDLLLYPSNDSRDVFEYDCGTFTSIDSQTFREILGAFSDFDSVLVTITNSEVKFSYERTEIVLNQEGGRCIIGGVTECGKIEFVITVKPMATFSNLSSRSKFVWLFKSSNSHRGVICFLLGLSARFLAYFSNVDL